MTLPVDKLCLKCDTIELRIPSATICTCGGELVDYDKDDPRQKIVKFNGLEMEMLKANFDLTNADWSKPDSMTDREWKDFLRKLT